MGLEGGLSAAGALSQVGGGLVAGLLSGAKGSAVAGLVAKEMLLNALPLYSLAQPIALATETIARAIQGEPNLPVVGFLLAPKVSVAQAKSVQTKIRDAALYVAGWDPWPRGKSPLHFTMPGSVLGELTDWIGDVNKLLNKALRDSGEPAVEKLLATHPEALRSLHVAVALSDWANAQGWPAEGFRFAAPFGYPLALAPQLPGVKLPPPPAGPKLLTRWPLFKALGIAPYATYKAVLAANAAPPPPPVPPLPSPKPATVNGPVLLASGLSALGGAPGSLGVSAGPVLPEAPASAQAPKPSSAGPVGLVAPAASSAPPASSSALPLALVGLALVAALVVAAKGPA